MRGCKDYGNWKLATFSVFNSPYRRNRMAYVTTEHQQEVACWLSIVPKSMALGAINTLNVYLRTFKVKQNNEREI